MITAVVTGIPEIDAKLKRMYLKDANRIGRAVVKEGAERAAYLIRQKIPASIKPKSPDAGIGVRIGRASKGAVAKAGTGVGKSQSMAPPLAPRGRRRGVGVSARNLHWFAVGTMERYTGSVRNRSKGAGKNARKSTGNAKRRTGRIRKEKFGQFVRMVDTADITLHMRAKFDKLYEKMATVGVSE